MVMSSQAQNTYTQPPLPPPPSSLAVTSQQLPPTQLQQQPPSSQGVLDPLSDSLAEGLPSYFTLNYAQQAALFLANAAAAAAASASAASGSAYSSPDMTGSTRCSVASQKAHANHMTAGSSSTVQDSFQNSSRGTPISPQSKHSALQPSLTPGKQNQRGSSTGKTTAAATGTSAGITGTVGDKSGELLFLELPHHLMQLLSVTGFTASQAAIAKHSTPMIVGPLRYPESNEGFTICRDWLLRQCEL